MLILAYHRVNPAGKDGLSVTPDMLRSQLTYLLSQGWENVGLEEVISPGIVPKHSKKFAIAFDDGYQDNYFHAYPTLSGLGMRAIVFVAAAYTNTRNAFPWVRASSPGLPLDEEDFPITWPQLSEMVRSGVFTVGSHTLTHPFLSHLDRSKARKEIHDSKQLLEDRLGVAASSFCYPAGDFNKETIELVGESGYTAAVVTPNRFVPETSMTLHRVGVYIGTSPFLFKLKVSPVGRQLQANHSGWLLRRELKKMYDHGKRLRSRVANGKGI